tara:strand:- start:194 stop:517 length:324 start_codon:yes stop_codon:yes gene_type:complete
MTKPKGNLYRWTDISVALEKVLKEIDNPSTEEAPKFLIKHERPFSLRMRMYQYIKAYRELAEQKGEGDPYKYDALRIKEVDEGVEVVHILDDLKELDVINTETGAKL